MMMSMLSPLAKPTMLKLNMPYGKLALGLPSAGSVDTSTRDKPVIWPWLVAKVIGPSGESTVMPYSSAPISTVGDPSTAP